MRYINSLQRKDKKNTKCKEKIYHFLSLFSNACVVNISSTRYHMLVANDLLLVFKGFVQDNL